MESGLYNKISSTSTVLSVRLEEQHNTRPRHSRMHTAAFNSIRPALSNHTSTPQTPFGRHQALVQHLTSSFMALQSVITVPLRLQTRQAGLPFPAPSQRTFGQKSENVFHALLWHVGQLMCRHGYYVHQSPTPPPADGFETWRSRTLTPFGVEQLVF